MLTAARRSPRRLWASARHPLTLVYGSASRTRGMLGDAAMFRLIGSARPRLARGGPLGSRRLSTIRSHESGRRRIHMAGATAVPPPRRCTRRTALSHRGSRLESRSRCRTTTTCRRLPTCRQLSRRPSFLCPRSERGALEIQAGGRLRVDSEYSVAFVPRAESRLARRRLESGCTGRGCDHAKGGTPPRADGGLAVAARSAGRSISPPPPRPEQPAGIPTRADMLARADMSASSLRHRRQPSMLAP